MLSIYRLPDHLPGEKVIKIIRKDFFVLFKKIVLFVILGGLPFLFFFVTNYSSTLNIGEGLIAYPLTIIFLSSYYLFLWLFFFFSFIDYYLDVWIITNERIIDIKQEGFFARTIAELRLYRLQDVTSEVKGIFSTLLGYGNVYAQTAGEKQRFFFKDVPRPEKIRDLLIKISEDSRKLHKGEEMT
ncbi:MAG: PH domain-containing protein [Patescibacteria group bacterium]|nr:PH domain-containing protein [Patescibacteria group bacterium]MDD4610939.1 PH domain-containing protein [Patescibacteria group bacterium]